jgi:transcriptional regulator with XRE-family HTH domain
VDLKEFGKTIKHRRKLLNITQKDLAGISGVTLRKLIDIENGVANPTIKTIIKLTESLGLSLELKVKS